MLSNIPDKELLQYIKDKTGSESLCLAKWFNATIWLNSGMTTSCHHPPAHKISLEGLKENPSLLHNTPEKKDDRQKMRQGQRPAGCDYCWKIEDNTGGISDRTYKSKIFTQEDLENGFNSGVDSNHTLRTLEISFSRACNFKCSYCNPAFSTQWVKDIRENGPYKDLVSDGRNHYTHTHDSAQLYNNSEDNPYIQAFWKWWHSDLKNDLDEIRITGGEPFLRKEVWTLMETYKTDIHQQHPKLPRLAINTNLSMDMARMRDLLKLAEYIPDFSLYTSCEATGQQAEYIRDGLVYEDFINNFKAIMISSVINLSNMCTINALCLPTLPDYLNKMLDLRVSMFKKPHDSNYIPSFTLNILRFPSFQSPLVLSDELRKHYAGQLKVWLWQTTLDTEKSPLVHAHELDHVNRLIEYLENVEVPHEEGFDLEKCRKDFKTFYTQYDKRRGKSFKDTFPEEMVAWYETL